MTTDMDLPSTVVLEPAHHPYNCSSSSAASSTSSVFSADALLQTNSSYSSASSESEKCSWDGEEPWRDCHGDVSASIKRMLPPIQTCEPTVASELRRHPRRSSTSSGRQPPSLVRQSDRKGHFVDCLVDSATQMVEVIWPLSGPHCPGEVTSGGVLPLRTFIQETLRRSRTSFSTLQVALYYLILIKPHVPKYNFTMEQLDRSASARALQCGRRMFLAALILASKYLQDRNYSARAWSRISGLRAEEINANELTFLDRVNWKLHLPEAMFERWQDVLIMYSSNAPRSPGSPSSYMASEWKLVVPSLTPELDTLDILPRQSLHLASPTACRSPTRFVDALDSHSSTPTPITPISLPPRFLEPSPHMLPPTPKLARLGPLPTPVLTPYSTASNTPAVSLASYGSRSSMCSAMAQARQATESHWAPRSYRDLAAYRLSARQTSCHLMSGSSLTSSPDSLISDISSRSSRASSISSASSFSSAHAWAPIPVKLNRLATLRCAGLPSSMSASQQLPPPQEEQEMVYVGSYTGEPLVLDPVSSPDVGLLRLSSTPTALPLRQREALQSNSPSKGRKRGRSSADLSIQENVRHFLAPSARSYLADPACAVLRDDLVAEPSLFLRSPCRTPTRSDYARKALQSPARSVPERRLPIQKDAGRKRACASEACAGMALNAGPGRWTGIL